MRSVVEALGLADVAEMAARAQQRMTPAQIQARLNERRGRAMLATATQQRDPHRAAKPTGVRIKGSNGVVLDVYDDGSHRKPWKRAPGLSGRQFRKLRKAVNRKLRAAGKAEATV